MNQTLTLAIQPDEGPATEYQVLPTPGNPGCWDLHKWDLELGHQVATYTCGPTGCTCPQWYYRGHCEHHQALGRLNLIPKTSQPVDEDDELIKIYDS